MRYVYNVQFYSCHNYENVCRSNLRLLSQRLMQQSVAWSRINICIQSHARNMQDKNKCAFNFDNERPRLMHFMQDAMTLACTWTCLHNLSKTFGIKVCRNSIKFNSSLLKSNEILFVALCTITSCYCCKWARAYRHTYWLVTPAFVLVAWSSN